MTDHRSRHTLLAREVTATCEKDDQDHQWFEIEEINLANNQLKTIDKSLFKNLNRTNKNRIFKLIKQDKISNQE